MHIAIIVALVIAAAAGVSFNADNALPGEALYDVKVGVNEEVRAAIAASAETQARVDAARAERRIEEAERLDARGELSAEVAADLEGRFEEHARSMDNEIQRLEARGDLGAAAEVSSEFEAALRAHERILERLSDRAESRIETILNRVRDRIRAVAEVRADFEARIQSEARADIEAAAEGRMHAAENKIREVRAFIERMEDRVDASSRAEAEARVDVAARLIADGEARLEAGEFGEAFVAFQEAHRTAQEAKLLLRAHGELGIDVEIDGDLDEDEDEDGDIDDDEEDGDDDDDEDDDGRGIRIEI